MGQFILKSLLQRLVLLFIVSIIAHAVVHIAPGEPSEVDPTNPRMKPEDVAKIRAAFHLDEPLHLQYVYWMEDLLKGELRSFKDGQPVLPKIWNRFLNSLPLFLGATLLIWTLSFPVGIHAAIKRGSTFDRSSTFVAYALKKALEDELAHVRSEIDGGFELSPAVQVKKHIAARARSWRRKIATGQHHDDLSVQGPGRDRRVEKGIGLILGDQAVQTAGQRHLRGVVVFAADLFD